MRHLDRSLTHSRRALVTAVGAVTMALTAAACGSTTPSAPTTSAPTTSSAPTVSASATIGTDCAMIPAGGMGSMHAMAMDPVVTAASHNPLLTTFASEVKKAGLAASLDSTKGLTVFAPDNTAFKKLFATDASMVSTMAELTKLLKYHVVSGGITPAELASGMDLKTLEGSQLKASKMGSTYEVNNAAVTCGNLHTANATVYIINTVLMPAH